MSARANAWWRITYTKNRKTAPSRIFRFFGNWLVGPVGEDYQDYQSNRQPPIAPLGCCSFDPLLPWAAQTSATYGHVVLQSVI